MHDSLVFMFRILTTTVLHGTNMIEAVAEGRAGVKGYEESGKSKNALELQSADGGLVVKGRCVGDQGLVVRSLTTKRPRRDAAKVFFSPQTLNHKP